MKSRVQAEGTMKLWVKGVVRGLSLLLVWSVFSFAVHAQSNDLLFVVYDMGEVNALTPVFKVLDTRQVPYDILPMGKASEVLKEHPCVKPTPFDSDFHSLTRETPLSLEQKSQLKEIFQPKVVVTSMTTQAQGELAMALKDSGAWVGAYYDNFDPMQEKGFVKPFLTVVKGLNAYITPSPTTQKSFEEWNAAKADPVSVVVLGQPSLESWKEAHQDQVLKKKVLELLKMEESAGQPVLLFAGGYDPTYEDAFRTFIKGVKGSDFKVFVTPHPKTDGQLEKGIVEAEGLKDQVRIVSPEEQKEGLSTMNLSLLKPWYLVCHKSTVCIQGLAVGIPALYVAEPDYKNFALTAGLAQRVSTEDEIHSLLQNKERKIPGSLEAVGIPSQAAERIADYLQERLASS